MPDHHYVLQTPDHLELFAQEWVSSSSPRGVIALIHGLGEHSGRYDHLAKWMNQYGFHVTAIDLRGHGHTAGARGHIPGYEAAGRDIDLLIADTAKRYPGLPIFLYGHSLGGALVLYHALKQHPAVKGVIATSPGLVPASPPTGATLLIAKVASKLAPSMLIDNGLDRSGLSRDPLTEEKYNADTLVHGKISAQLGLALINNGRWIIENGAQFSLPLLLMVGSKDRLVNPSAVDQLAKVIPAHLLTYKVWDGFYHELHNEPEKELVFEKIYLWLEKHK